jgi:hypothetical protein
MPPPPYLCRPGPTKLTEWLESGGFQLPNTEQQNPLHRDQLLPALLSALARHQRSHAISTLARADPAPSARTRYPCSPAQIPPSALASNGAHNLPSLLPQNLVFSVVAPPHPHLRAAQTNRHHIHVPPMDWISSIDAYGTRSQPSTPCVRTLHLRGISKTAQTIVKRMLAPIILRSSSSHPAQCQVLCARLPFHLVSSRVHPDLDYCCVCEHLDVSVIYVMVQAVIAFFCHESWNVILCVPFFWHESYFWLQM